MNCIENYTRKKKFSQYLCFLIKSTILDISLSNCIHEFYYRIFTCTCLLCDKLCLYLTVSTKFQNTRCARAALNRQGYSQKLFDIERELFILQLSGENPV